jgi:hypothetical protein
VQLNFKQSDFLRQQQTIFQPSNLVLKISISEYHQKFKLHIFCKIMHFCNNAKTLIFYTPMYLSSKRNVNEHTTNLATYKPSHKVSVS